MERNIFSSQTGFSFQDQFLKMKRKEKKNGLTLQCACKSNKACGPKKKKIQNL